MCRSSLLLALPLVFGLLLAWHVEDITPHPDWGAPTPRVCRSDR